MSERAPRILDGFPALLAIEEAGAGDPPPDPNVIGKISKFLGVLFDILGKKGTQMPSDIPIFSSLPARPGGYPPVQVADAEPALQRVALISLYSQLSVVKALADYNASNPSAPIAFAFPVNVLPPAVKDAEVFWYEFDIQKQAQIRKQQIEDWKRNVLASNGAWPPLPEEDQALQNYFAQIKF